MSRHRFSFVWFGIVCWAAILSIAVWYGWSNYQRRFNEQTLEQAARERLDSDRSPESLVMAIDRQPARSSTW